MARSGRLPHSRRPDGAVGTGQPGDARVEVRRQPGSRRHGRLTVNGLRNGAATTAPLDLGYLDALPQVECSVDDRLAEGRQVTFRGVLLSTVLSALGVQNATRLRADALNDYSVDLPMSDVTESAGPAGHPPRRRTHDGGALRAAAGDLPDHRV